MDLLDKNLHDKQKFLVDFLKTSETLDGEKKKSIEIAKKLKSMNVDIQTIVESTGLTREEIEKL